MLNERRSVYMTLNEKQKEAVALATNWFTSQDKQVFTIGGYAGTGKTTVAKAIIDALSVKSAFVAYTGKAANVMATKGMHGAGTIHSLIYKAVKNSDGSFSFFKKKKLKGFKLIVLDEASMVGKDIFRDLLSFHVPILALGDPGQLPPVASLRTNLLKNSDVLLEETMRQDEGSGIVRFAEAVRNGHVPELSDDGKYGDEVKIMPISKLTSSVDNFVKVVSKSQVICGYNATRKSFNIAAKSTVFDKDPYHLEKGDKVICLENDRFCTANSDIGTLSLSNGTMGIMSSDAKKEAGDKFFTLLIPEINAKFKAPFRYQRFLKDRHELNFDLAYAITCHKSQGSEYDNLTVIDEPVGAKAEQWRYTAITRAKKQLLYLV